MEIAVLLLLIVTLTAASPIRPLDRSDADIILEGNTVQPPAVKTSEETQEQHVQALRIVPFQSEDKHLDLTALKHKMAVKLRPRRAPKPDCPLGTCQVHNLANTLYILGKKNGKENSQTAHDPQGFGR